MRVYVDMDGVIANFYAGVNNERRGWGQYPEMYEVGFFEELPPMKGSLEAMRRLIGLHDVWILTKPVKESAHSYSEKVRWILKWFPELMGKIVMTQDKSLLARSGDVLIDDSAYHWQKCWTEVGGVFIHFDEDVCPLENWAKVYKCLENLNL